MKRLISVIGIALCCTSCEVVTGTEPDGTNNIAIFDEVWSEFDRHYSFFELKGIDWDSSRARYRSRANAAVTGTALANVIWDMLDDLRDVHVTFSTPNRSFFDTSHDSRPDFFNPDDVVFRKYVTSARATPLNRFRYGIIDGDIGYIWIPEFGNTGWATRIDDVIQQLGTVRSIIIDVRSNGGGASSNSDEIAGRFTDEERTYSYVRFRNGPKRSDFTGDIAQKIQPRGKFIDLPVAVLTNRHTYSAAETFVLSMRSVPNTIIAGDTTGGGSGNPLPRELPNGWRYQVPQWIQFDAHHQPIEDRGIVPDIVVRSRSTDRDQLRDPVLEAAVIALRARGG
jgi:hypothetical protein